MDLKSELLFVIYLLKVLSISILGPSALLPHPEITTFTGGLHSLPFNLFLLLHACFAF